MKEKVFLKHTYSLRFGGLEEYRNAVWKIICEDYFIRYISNEDTVLDLGCGWGEFINNIKCATKLGLDLNPESSIHLSKEVYFINQDCSQTWPIRTSSLDIVFTSNLLEHLPGKDYIERTISETYRCLKEEGLMICVGPNINYLPGRYWDFWDHFTPITEKSLSEILKIKGFQIEKVIPQFLPYSMSLGNRYPLSFVRLYLKLPFLWRVWGKQFLVIGKKPKVSC